MGENKGFILLGSPNTHGIIMVYSLYTEIFRKELKHLCISCLNKMLLAFCAGISRDSWHKRRHTGGKMKPLRKKRKFELGRAPANTKVSGRGCQYIQVID
jgi:hypothetical protein